MKRPAAAPLTMKHVIRHRHDEDQAAIAVCCPTMPCHTPPITKLLDAALRTARNLPPHGHDNIARAVLRLIGTDDEAKQEFQRR
jgi:hypothetical protein